MGPYNILGSGDGGGVEVFISIHVQPLAVRAWPAGRVFFFSLFFFASEWVARVRGV